MPESINRKYELNLEPIITLLEKANLKIGELNGYAELVPNVDMFIMLHLVKEATASSKIEGTKTEIDEALLQEEDIMPERRNDWWEVSNYNKAMNKCLEELDHMPISSRLLKEAHSILLEGVRGEHEMPGEYRTSQNWIGGTSPDNAFFVPPLWHEVNSLMGDLENFLHNENTNLPTLIKAGIAHYQFETIHPFLDGNGRIGRLLIILYLISFGTLRKPVLYLSDYFERNRNEYYDHLTRVRENSDITDWLKFFLRGIIEMSEKSISGLQKVILLKKDCEENRIARLGKRQNHAAKLLNELFHNPVIKAEGVSELCGVSIVTAYSLIEDMVRLHILNEITGNKRNRIFTFTEYINIFK